MLRIMFLHIIFFIDRSYQSQYEKSPDIQKSEESEGFPEEVDIGFAFVKKEERSEGLVHGFADRTENIRQEMEENPQQGGYEENTQQAEVQVKEVHVTHQQEQKETEQIAANQQDTDEDKEDIIENAGDNNEVEPQDTLASKENEIKTHEEGEQNEIQSQDTIASELDNEELQDAVESKEDEVKIQDEEDNEELKQCKEDSEEDVVIVFEVDKGEQNEVNPQDIAESKEDEVKIQDEEDVEVESQDEEDNEELQQYKNDNEEDAVIVAKMADYEQDNLQPQESETTEDSKESNTQCQESEEKSQQTDNEPELTANEVKQEGSDKQKQSEDEQQKEIIQVVKIEESQVSSKQLQQPICKKRRLQPDLQHEDEDDIKQNSIKLQRVEESTPKSEINPQTQVNNLQEQSTEGIVNEQKLETENKEMGVNDVQDAEHKHTDCAEDAQTSNTGPENPLVSAEHLDNQLKVIDEIAEKNLDVKVVDENLKLPDANDQNIYKTDKLATEPKRVDYEAEIIGLTHKLINEGKETSTEIDTIVFEESNLPRILGVVPQKPEENLQVECETNPQPQKDTGIEDTKQSKDTEKVENYVRLNEDSSQTDAVFQELFEHLTQSKDTEKVESFERLNEDSSQTDVVFQELNKSPIEPEQEKNEEALQESDEESKQGETVMQSEQEKNEENSKESDLQLQQTEAVLISKQSEDKSNVPECLVNSKKFVRQLAVDETEEEMTQPGQQNLQELHEQSQVAVEKIDEENEHANNKSEQEQDMSEHKENLQQTDSLPKNAVESEMQAQKEEVNGQEGMQTQEQEDKKFEEPKDLGESEKQEIQAVEVVKNEEVDTQQPENINQQQTDIKPKNAETNTKIVTEPIKQKRLRKISTCYSEADENTKIITECTQSEYFKIVEECIVVNQDIYEDKKVYTKLTQNALSENTEDVQEPEMGDQVSIKSVDPSEIERNTLDSDIKTAEVNHNEQEAPIIQNMDESEKEVPELSQNAEETSPKRMEQKDEKDTQEVEQNETKDVQVLQVVENGKSLQFEPPAQQSEEINKVEEVEIQTRCLDDSEVHGEKGQHPEFAEKMLEANAQVEEIAETEEELESEEVEEACKTIEDIQEISETEEELENEEVEEPRIIAEDIQEIAKIKEEFESEDVEEPRIIAEGIQEIAEIEEELKNEIVEEACETIENIQKIAEIEEELESEEVEERCTEIENIQEIAEVEEELESEEVEEPCKTIEDIQEIAETEEELESEEVEERCTEIENIQEIAEIEEELESEEVEEPCKTIEDIHILAKIEEEIRDAMVEETCTVTEDIQDKPKSRTKRSATLLKENPRTSNLSLSNTTEGKIKWVEDGQSCMPITIKMKMFINSAFLKMMNEKNTTKHLSPKIICLIKDSLGDTYFDTECYLNFFEEKFGDHDDWYLLELLSLCKTLSRLSYTINLSSESEDLLCLFNVNDLESILMMLRMRLYSEHGVICEIKRLNYEKKDLNFYDAIFYLHEEKAKAQNRTLVIDQQRLAEETKEEILDKLYSDYQSFIYDYGMHANEDDGMNRKVLLRKKEDQCHETKRYGMVIENENQNINNIRVTKNNKQNESQQQTTEASVVDADEDEDLTNYLSKNVLTDDVCDYISNIPWYFWSWWFR